MVHNNNDIGYNTHDLSILVVIVAADPMRFDEMEYSGQYPDGYGCILSRIFQFHVQYDNNKTFILDFEIFNK